MAVASLTFLGFALAVAALYNLLNFKIWRRSILLAANLYFLTTFSNYWKAWLPFVGFLICAYIGIRLMLSRRFRGVFFPILILEIGLFVWLKKYTFIPASDFLQFPYVTIGLSYIFFRVLHLLIDAQDGVLLVRLGPIDFLNYTLNFTTLVAGPIQRYDEFASMQSGRLRPPLTLSIIGRAVERILIGFFKLRVLSLVLPMIHNIALNALGSYQPTVIRVVTAGTIAVIYPFYLYFNFSGYTDLMIGVARFLRLELPENFDRPLSSASFIEFWSRWHITLSMWLKTYVYTPGLKLLMSRIPSERAEPYLGVVAYFVTFFLVGIWHGQTSEFVVFGFLQGLGVSLNKLYQVLMTQFLGRKNYRTLRANTLYVSIARGLTFTYFSFSLVWFWANWQQLRSMEVALGTRSVIIVWIAIWVVSSGMLSFWEAIRERALSVSWDGTSAVLSAPIRAAWVVYLAIIAVIVSAIDPTSTPILYQIF